MACPSHCFKRPHLHTQLLRKLLALPLQVLAPLLGLAYRRLHPLLQVRLRLQPAPTPSPSTEALNVRSLRLAGACKCAGARCGETWRGAQKNEFVTVELLTHAHARGVTHSFCLCVSTSVCNKMHFDCVSTSSCFMSCSRRSAAAAQSAATPLCRTPPTVPRNKTSEIYGIRFVRVRRARHDALFTHALDGVSVNQHGTTRETKRLVVSARCCTQFQRELCCKA